MFFYPKIFPLFLLALLFISFAAQTAGADGKAKIGIIAPITGELSEWGEGIVRGATIAAEENDFSLEVADEEFCNSGKALQAAQAMLAHGNTIIMVSCLNGLHAVQPILEKKNVVLLSAGLTENLSKDKRVVSLSGQVTDEALFLSHYLNSDGEKKVHTIRVDDNFTAAFMSVFNQQPGISIVKDDAVPPGASSFGTLLLSTKALKPDLRLLSLGNDQLSALLKARQVYHDTVPLFGQYIIESNPLPEDQRTLLNGVKYSYPDLGDESRRKDFSAHYSEKFGADQSPTVNSFFVYDGLAALRSAIDTCKSSEDADCILSNLRNGKPRAGIGGTFSYSNEGTVTRDFILKEVREGKFVSVIPKS